MRESKSESKRGRESKEREQGQKERKIIKLSKKNQGIQMRKLFV